MKALIWFLIKKNKYFGGEYEKPNKAIGQVSLDISLQSF